MSNDKCTGGLTTSYCFYSYTSSDASNGTQKMRKKLFDKNVLCV